MCGIFGYVGKKNALHIILEGIKKLEYRGYDSAGIAALGNGKLFHHKEVGKVAKLEEALKEKLIFEYPESFTENNVAISHTRWATHGKPTQANAHPHFDTSTKLALVHNGIIENHEQLRRVLERKGVQFRSDTDTEVLSQLIGYLYKGNFLKAVQMSLFLVKGTFAISAIHEQHPGQIVCAARESPLAIGLGEGESFIASDSQAFLKYTRRAIYLREAEVALVTPDSVQAYNERALPISKEIKELGFDVEEVSKGKFAHYTLKEIHEQPQTVRNALLSRFCEIYGTAILEEIAACEAKLLKAKRIIILGCGTSWHAGLLGAYMIEENARIPVQVEISSEFRYKNPIVEQDTLAIAISQSGETADTLAALRELKEKGATVIGICNVQGSTIAREVDSCLFLRAGPEIAVASTKAFTSQLTLLALLTLRLARSRTLSQQEGKRWITALTQLPQQIEHILGQQEAIRTIAKKYSSYENFFFLGRRYMYPTALEGALKLKEIAYVNANGYPGGEIKHGPIALIHENCPTVALLADAVTYSKMLSNLQEIKARSGKIIAIAQEGSEDILSLADDVLWIPKTEDFLSPLLATIVTQELAYFIALERGAEIDQPRNLAKSVTVE